MKEDRIFQGADDLWYFNVRGKLTKGPFETHQAAEAALGEHVRRCSRSLGAPPWMQPLRSFRLSRIRAS